MILDIAKYNGLETDGRVTRLVREFERSRRDLRADDDRIEKEEAKRTSLEDVGKKVDAVNKVAKAGETIAKVSEWFLGWI
ncbi:MAG: hypothetical protein P8Q48_14775 [Paracoccaceae bacterium]|nr:hypothetical protein [Paracoccaceae bacterium]MDG1371480.1 hypothetical protein [Paracoccaceae bacterium]